MYSIGFEDTNYNRAFRSYERVEPYDEQWLNATRGCGCSTICGEAGAPFCAECVTMDNAVVAVVQTLTTQEKHKRKNRNRTLVKKLEKLGYLRIGIDNAGDAWVWLSDE